MQWSWNLHSDLLNRLRVQGKTKCYYVLSDILVLLISSRIFTHNTDITTIIVIIQVMGISNCAIVYVESICRVTTLSISGSMLYRFADYLFVQWPKLKEKYPKSIYKGRFS